MNVPMDDDAARQTIRTELDRTYFVEAGAGTGKTTALVARIVGLVLTGRARIGKIAAITFTEAAAEELRERIANAFDQAASDEPAMRDRAASALAELDQAAITTIHGFARRILAEHPFEAGLPPVFEVLDEMRSSVAFEERWNHFVDRMLADPELDAPLRAALACGIRLDHLQVLARRFDDSWDLVAGSALDTAAPMSALPPVDLASVVGPLGAAVELRHCCSNPEDLLLRHIESLAPFLDELVELVAPAVVSGSDGVTAEEGIGSRSDEVDLLQALAGGPTIRSKLGQARDWEGRVDEVRTLLGQADEARSLLLQRTALAALGHLMLALAQHTLHSARVRRADGRLEYHDLLVYARELVRRADIRGGLRRRYRYLLIDELQDTDPIQMELAMRLAAPDDAAANGDAVGPDDGASDSHAAPSGDAASWQDLFPEPGRLFLVGDPKQSIYRFRRAEVGLFMAARERFGRPMVLHRNRRSVPGIIDWVNAVFDDLMADDGSGLQVRFQPLTAHRRPHEGAAGPPVVLMGGPLAAEALMADVRRAEAIDIANAIGLARAERWPVGEDGRAVRLSDITILIPARTALAHLEEGLDAAGIPYRLESSSLVYASDDVVELLNVLRAVDDPTNDVAVMGALRSRGFGCGDDDLLEYHLAGGKWDYRSSPPEDLGLDHPVVEAQLALWELHRTRIWSDPPDLIERIVRERRLLEIALDGPRPRETWRRLRFVVDQARQFTEATGGGLHQYLAWTESQQRSDARATETVLPETDLDAVRIMTIHASKGLEFPVVVLAGLHSSAGAPSGPRVLFGHRGVEVSITKKLRTPGFDELDQEADLEQAERIRLLYVAATRAADHLMVSVTRGDRGSGTLAELIDRAAADHPNLWRRLVDPTAPGSGSGGGSASGSRPDPDRPQDRRPDPTRDSEAVTGAASRAATPAPEADGPVARAEWMAERAQLLEAAAQPWVVAATSMARLAREAAPDQTDLTDPPDRADLADQADQADLAELTDPTDPGEGDGEVRHAHGVPARRRGRAGAALGRAVHAVLQHIDLASGAGLGERARIEAQLEGIPTRADEVERLVQAALASETVRAAVTARRYWREIYVGVPVAGRVVEGVVDLLVEVADGYQVVDFKTDQVSSDRELLAAAARHRLQGATYALALEQALGRPVCRCTFLFLRPGGAVACDVEDLREAIDEVSQVLAGVSGSPADGLTVG